MNAAVQPFATLQMPNGGTRRFNTYESFEKWLNLSEQSWGWFLSDGSRSPNVVALSRTALVDFFSECRAALAEVRAGSADTGQALEQIGKNIFPQGVPVSAEDPMVLAVRGKFERISREAAVIAVGTAIYLESNRIRVNVNSPLVDLNHPIAVQAAGYAAAVREVVHLRDKRSLRTVLDSVTNEVDDLLAVGTQRLEQFRTAADTLFNQATAASTELVAQTREAADKAVERINTTRDTYEELMRLKAPTDYWAAKCTTHRAEAKNYRRWLAGLAVGGVVLMAAVYAAGWFALDEFAKVNAKGSIAMTLYVAGFVGAVTAIVLWFIRIVVRLYMSQHHLAADADERASMIRTYLALTESGKVTEDERSLVLASVFRPVPDGIVKDDGAPAFGPANLIASILDKK